jgi:hypothetical protein
MGQFPEYSLHNLFTSMPYALYSILYTLYSLLFALCAMRSSGMVTFCTVYGTERRDP